QPFYNVLGLRNAGDHDDVDVEGLRRTNALTELEPSDVWHHAIGDDQRRPLTFEDLQRLAAVARQMDALERSGQRVLEDFEMDRRIIHDEDVNATHQS